MQSAPRIGFKRHLAARTVPGEGVYLISAQGTTVITGPGIEAVAPLLDGTRTMTEVQGVLAPAVPARHVLDVVGRLAEADLLSTRDGACPDEVGPAGAAYWELAGLDPDRVATALDRGRVRVVAAEPMAAAVAAELADECRVAGLTVAGDGQDAVTFTLVLCEDYLEPGLAELNARFLASGRPWLPVKPTGTDIWIGPLFGERGTPCLSCLTQRLRGHRMVESYLQTAVGDHGPVRPPTATLPATHSFGLRAAVLETVKWLAGYRYPGQDQLLAIDTLSLESRRHPVVRRPQCPDCGDPDLVAAQTRRPVRPASRQKAAPGGNGHRAVPAAEHWERYRHLADPVTGVVDELRRDPGSPPFVHCYLAGRNLAMSADGLRGVRAGLRQHSGGKGATDLQARVSALSEAAERYSGSRHGDELAVRDSLAGLGSAAVHPNEVMLFHDRQYGERKRWNADRLACQTIPEPFDDRAVIEWTPVWSLTRSVQRLLPTSLLYYRGPGQATGGRFARADSNGNAAGASLEDAIVQGFLELVERDAVALWWYNRTRHRGVRLDVLGDPWFGELVEHYREHGRRIWVLDVTSDLRIPVMVAISRRAGGPAEDIMLGFGAHFDPVVAVRRALTEHGQLLSATSAAKPAHGPLDRRLRHWWDTATVANQPYLLPDPTAPLSTLSEHPCEANGDLGDDVADILGLARRHALEVLVLDQTRPDIGMPVVKVIAPGLRHFWARFAPGRLYDVPVELGRLESPTRYEDLNPIALFL